MILSTYVKLNGKFYWLVPDDTVHMFTSKHHKTGEKSTHFAVCNGSVCTLTQPEE